MFQVKRSPQVFDVVVVGSGAGGGTAVKVLTDLGVSVALLEAGPMLNPAKDFKEHVLPYQVDHRGAGSGVGYVNQDPHVFYLMVESDRVDWTVSVEEAVAGTVTAPQR